MSEFQPGDVVVCVNDRPAGNRDPRVQAAIGSARLVYGSLYNVADVVPVILVDGTVTDRRTLILSQAEARWTDPIFGGPGGWHASRFRRVYRPDRSLIGKLLEPITEDVSQARSDTREAQRSGATEQ